MSTTLLLHFNGDDESTTITDESGLSWTAISDAKLDTAQKNLGTASLILTDTNDSVRTTNTGSYASGYDDFSFEAFVRFSSLSMDDMTIFCPGWQSMIKFTATFEDHFLLYACAEDGSTVLSYEWGEDVILVNTWYHICVSRASNIWRAFWDGTKVDEYDDTAQAYSWGYNDVRLYIGNDSQGGRTLPGWIDEVRYCMGEAKYTANFTPPIAEYSLEESPYSRTIEDTCGATDVIMSNAFNFISEELHFISTLGEKHSDLLTESLDFYDQDGLGNVYLSVIEDGAGLADLPDWLLGLIISDTFANTDAVTDWLKSLWIYESLALSGVTQERIGKVLQDRAMIWDVSQIGWHKLVPDTFAATDVVTKLLGLIIPDVLTLIDAQFNNWDGVHTIEETAVIRDSSVFAQYLKSIADTMDLADLPRLLLTIPISDWLTLNDAVPLIIRAAILESMLLSDTSLWGWDKTIADTFATADAPSALATFNRAIAESLALASAASFLKTCGVSVPDTMALTDVSASAVKLYNIILESLALNALLDLDGELWECFALNTPRFHASMYSGYNFNSFCVFNGRAFGANDAGIFELTGSTDAGNPIHTGVILKGTDFGTPNQKRMRRGYFGVSGSSPVLILETESGQRQVYSIDTKGKTVASHELKSKSWTLSIADFDALDSVKLIPVILSK
jgi:hypothetical protein